MSKRGKSSWHAFRNPLIAACLILSAVICIGIFSKAQKVQTAHAEAKAQPSTFKSVEKKEEIYGGKEKGCEEDHIPEIEPEVHRRILRFLNAARSPEDLMFPPQNEFPVIDEEALHVGHEHKVPVKKPEPLMDLELAKCVFEWRERNRPLGFTHMSQLLTIGIVNDRLQPAIDLLKKSLSLQTFGAWSVLKDKDGNTITTQIQGKTQPIRIAMVHAALLHTGKVLFIPHQSSGVPYTLLWGRDPKAGNIFKLIPVPTIKNNKALPKAYYRYLYCSGHSFLSDGKLLVVGGGGHHPSHAITAGWKFNPDPTIEEWEPTTNPMKHKRWYPTVVTLGGNPGRVLVVNGGSDQMEIYSEDTGSFSLVKGPATSPKLANRPFPGYYPGLHLLPGGEIFYTRTGWGPLPPNSPTEDAAYFKFSDLSSGIWKDLPLAGGSIRNRRKGMSAMLLRQRLTDPDRIIVVGGGGDTSSNKTAEFITLPGLPPLKNSNHHFPDLKSRINVNVVLLPDGTVFICGGIPKSGRRLNGGPCLLYNPLTNTWAEMAVLNYPRGYHSVALLLPSGQVMVTGGDTSGKTGGTDETIEIFSPPYLFRGPQPTIASDPKWAYHDATFDITTPQAPDIDRVVLVRPMAVTHQTDTEQRVISLKFEKLDSKTLRVTAPDGRVYPYGAGGGHTHAVAPRGYYMLFILNKDGVPSEAKFIKLR